MKEVAKRLKTLRANAMVSQARLAQALETTQPAINRYENAQSTPPVKIFRAYADYFDVSMDYIFARTEQPQGKLYEYNPHITSDNEDVQKFIEMCFDPDSPVSGKLKDTLFKMMTGGEDE